METLKQMVFILVGDLAPSESNNGFLRALKTAYLVFLLPSFLFACALGARGGGAFGREIEEIGLVKRIFFHIAMVFWALSFWVIAKSMFQDGYSK